MIEQVGDPAGVAHMARLLDDGGAVVLSGAGLSTESGIPDYRGSTGASLRRLAPMTFQAVVDGLHSAAGSRVVVDLHGRLDRVVCLSCREVTSRRRLDDRLTALNREWRATATAVNPDGDVELGDELLDGFTVVDCDACGGVLKPDVVYFGGNVPAERVEASYRLVAYATSIVVLGSSLTVFSGRRFVMRAVATGMPVMIVNEGPTRADDTATVKVSAPLGLTLTHLLELLAPTG